MFQADWGLKRKTQPFFVNQTRLLYHKNQTSFTSLSPAIFQAKTQMCNI